METDNTAAAELSANAAAPAATPVSAQPPTPAQASPDIPALPPRVDGGDDIEKILGDVSKVFGQAAGPAAAMGTLAGDEIDDRLNELAAIAPSPEMLRRQVRHPKCPCLRRPTCSDPRPMKARQQRPRTPKAILSRKSKHKPIPA